MYLGKTLQRVRWPYILNASILHAAQSTFATVLWRGKGGRGRGKGGPGGALQEICSLGNDSSAEEWLDGAIGGVSEGSHICRVMRQYSCMYLHTTVEYVDGMEEKERNG